MDLITFEFFKQEMSVRVDIVNYIGCFVYVIASRMLVSRTISPSSVIEVEGCLELWQLFPLGQISVTISVISYSCVSNGLYQQLYKYKEEQSPLEIV